MRAFIFLIFIIGFLLIPLYVENSFGDNIKTRTSAFPHADLTNQSEGNAQNTLHNDTFAWKKGDEYISYAVEKEWKFEHNNLMDGKFTRTWNHTMEDHENQKFNGTIHNWWTGLTLYRIGEVDTVSGTYEMDFYYWIQIFEDNDPVDFLKIEPNVDFVNAVDYEITHAKGIIQKQHYYEAVVSGLFYSKMGFEKFPFDTISLEVIVEPWINDTSYSSLSDSIQLHAWPYPALVPETPSPGYEIREYDITVLDNQYSEGDTYSSYTATFDIQREQVGSFLKFIAPIFLMSGLAMAALVFPSDEFMTKIELNAIFLLGILFFVQVVSAEIPTTGAMTVFDHVVMLNYIFIVITIGIPAVKWYRRIDYENIRDNLEKIVIKDKRDTDLSNYALNSISLQIISLSLKLQDPDLKENKNEIREKIEKLEGNRDRILGEMEENRGKRHDVHSRTEVDEKYKKEKMSVKWSISDLFRSPKKESTIALTEMNSEEIKEKEKKLEKEYDELLKYYGNCNKVAWVLIGSAALIYGYFIGNILVG